MADEQQLQNLSRIMEHQTRLLQQKVAVARSELLALGRQRELISESQTGGTRAVGQKVNALSCWNRNQFSSLTNEVLLLLDQKLAERQQNLEQLQVALEAQRKKAQGLAWLADKAALKRRDKNTRLMTLESDEILQRQR